MTTQARVIAFPTLHAINREAQIVASEGDQ